MATVAIRAVEDGDAEIFFENQADPVAAQMAAFPSRDRATYFDHLENRVLVDPRNIVRTITVGAAVAGNIMCWPDEELGRLFGYWLGREFWGRGVATASVSAFLAEFDERPLHAFVAAHNIGSQRVLEKNGFVRAAQAPHTGDDAVEELLYVLT